MELAFPLIADYSFPAVTDITPQWLLSRGIQGILVDLDNTLAPYRQAEPDGEIVRWARGVEDGGVKVLVLSNNHEPRVERFCREMEVPYLFEAEKPHRRAYERGLERLALPKERVAAVGDQIFTDTLGAKRAGLRMILVRPVRLRGYFWYVLRRAAELPFVWLTREKYSRRSLDTIERERER